MATFKKTASPYNKDKNIATITRQPTQENNNSPYITFSEGDIVTFQGKTGRIETIDENGMSAYVNGQGSVPVDNNTVIRIGGKSRKRKSRKSRKTRRYRRV